MTVAVPPTVLVPDEVGAPTAGARLALICTVVNAGALAARAGVSVTTSWNFSVVEPRSAEPRTSG